MKNQADKLDAELSKATAPPLSPDILLALLRKKRHTTEQLVAKYCVPEKTIMQMIRMMQKNGVLLYLFGDQWGVEKLPGPSGKPADYLSREDNTFLFGIASDNHLGSKYERLDVLNDLYDKFAAEGVDRVFNAGNWIDGEARFNKFDLSIHGMDQQIEYMADVYPKRDGIVTYAVAGDDHEGWYGQREGIDIGKHAERIMRDAGRDDWVHVGFMESFIGLKNANSGKASNLLLQHPGGGSSYALSYVVQKIVESFEGGEKPAVLISGHYHKLWTGDIRNVWCLMAGCTQDQTTFMRKKRISAHVGGLIVKLTQDPRTGAITACRPEMFRYFNKGYYNNRWSHGGKVQLPERSDKKGKP
jgi:hypothetical protein